MLFTPPNHGTRTDRCIDQLSQLTEPNRRLVNVSYFSPAVEGTNVTFSCKDPHLLYEGPDSVTCMENGKWEPDPKNVKCIWHNG